MMAELRREAVCAACGKRYELQRSTSRFCSGACRLRAHRAKPLSVTLSVTSAPVTPENKLVTEAFDRDRRQTAHDIIGLAGVPCDFCGGHVGLSGLRSGPVFQVRNPLAADLIEPLHEDCATHWHDWLGKIYPESRARMLAAARARMLAAARDRMRARVKGEGGQG